MKSNQIYMPLFDADNAVLFFSCPTAENTRSFTTIETPGVFWHPSLSHDGKDGNAPWLALLLIPFINQ